jgi:hypothetical protein
MFEPRATIAFLKSNCPGGPRAGDASATDRSLAIRPVRESARFRVRRVAALEPGW